MKLIELSSDKESFNTLRFNSEGLTLIIGDGALDKQKEGSSNGVGKTLSLGLVHHCLGANTNALLKSAVPDWMFRLNFSIGNNVHLIERSGEGKKIFLDGKKTSLAGLRAWLDDSGVFRLAPNTPMISFRSLIKRFGRYVRKDCDDPLQTARENDFEARLRSLYLLGVDENLAASKRARKADLDALKLKQKTWQNDEILKKVFRAGTQPKVRAEWLEREIPKLREDLSRFQVAEDYRAIELRAGALTQQLREEEKKIAILNFQLEGINKSLVQHPDISKDDLLDFYSGIEKVFRPEILLHFDAVETFHNSLSFNRRDRLEKDKARLTLELKGLEKGRQEIAQSRDRQLQSLQGKRALDEYAAIAKKLAEYEEEKIRLDEFLNLSVTLAQNIQDIREARVEEDRMAADYAATNPVREADRFFSSLAEQMYPNAPSGIVLENNTGDNQLRYDLTVSIEGDDSDGINAARILCFDWLIFMKGANHSVDFLWHDNRLFADLDPKARAAWFSYVLKAMEGTGKQYIASLNTENYAAMSEYLSGEDQSKLDQAIKLRLLGDNPEHKLLGIQFGRNT